MDIIDVKPILKFFGTGSSIKQKLDNKWAFSYETEGEILWNRWWKHEGWDYYETFIGNPPTLIVTAQCVSNFGYDPFA